MGRILCLCLLIAGFLLASSASARAQMPMNMGTPAVAPGADPTACTGYTPPRVYMEDQSWWDPQLGPPSHPGTGKMGHIHVETCFPLYQHFGATGTVPFDITVRLHNMPAPLKFLDVWAYGDYLQRIWNINWQCPVVDCVRQFHIDFPLEKLKYSGTHALMIAAWTEDQSGARQYTLPRWPVSIDNGKPLPPPDSIAGRTAAGIDAGGVIGDSWHETNNDVNGHYAGTAMARADFPWDPATGQNVVKSGIWTPTVGFEKQTAFAYIDPMLHATPPTQAAIVYNNVGGLWPDNKYTKLRIDTTTLPDGQHKLLLGTCNQLHLGMHCGTQVIRFTVKNHPDVENLGDRTLPQISMLSLSPKRFHAARSMRKHASAAAMNHKHGARTKSGTMVQYMLSEDAVVKFRLKRAVDGKRSHGRCVAPKRVKRRAKRCTRLKTLRGSFKAGSHEGMNDLKFKGRLRGKKQRAGRYRLVAVATDPSGNHSKPATARFRILKG